MLTGVLAIVINFLSQFTASLDGNPDASNPYIKYYVPYCVNSQLLVHVAIYSAACFLTDTGHVERTVAMAHKGHVIKLLNEHIRSQLSTSDEVIAGVLQIILDEWYVLLLLPFVPGGRCRPLPLLTTLQEGSKGTR
jgi:hypothetical protein